ncbi:TonB family protein [Brevundimonas sp.]|uniref:TonB family protein n=1 Tax=Brevundimonas sp. TaxID=1871086 RepID=UPI002D49D0F6|nr:TonB family protein [Brevundimonas sp.]HYC69069.1 TonB family protein [Brevundimonas sp.]
MRNPFQSLSPARGVSAAAASLVWLAAFGVIAQERPHAPGPPAGDASPAPVPAPPIFKEDRIAIRPPDCLDCRPSPPPRPSVITNPAWASPPSPEYPKAAMDAAVASGRVTLSCIVLQNGVLTNCEVRDETPPGLGFAESALVASARARVSPRTVDGAAELARVTFTVRYILAPEPTPPSPAPQT